MDLKDLENMSIEQIEHVFNEAKKVAEKVASQPRQPETKLSYGTVTVSRWKNRFNDMATIEKRYKDKDGSWKTSTSYTKADVIVIIHALNKLLETWPNE